MRLEGKIALVTGAGGGQGQATTELFAAEGATVYAADISPGRYGSDAIRHRHLDVGEDAQWRELVKEIEEAEGRIDVLVNNAAISGVANQLTDISLETWDRTLKTNLNGPFLGMRAVIPLMESRGSGSIVNICSIVVIRPATFLPAVHASKGGLRALGMHAARVYADRGIRVNTIFPGLIDTPMLGQREPELAAPLIASIPFGRLGAPEEVARASLFLASDEASYITGAELVVDGGKVIC
jgi:NAD(P)-dependent dehydrogenase (short-subunit alcohol dehydrogenase family)